MAQSESSSQTEVEAGAGVDMSAWVDLPPIAVQRPRLSEERITQLIKSLRGRAIYPNLTRVRRATQLNRMRTLLADWRAAERGVDDASKNGPEINRLRADCDRLRDEYHRLFGDRMGQPPGA